MRSFRREGIVYTLALAFLALMAVASYIIIDNIVTRQQHMATVIDVSSRQRMLCQRIALMGLQLEQSLGGVERERVVTRLRESIDQMRRSHRNLVEGSLAQGIEPPQREGLKAIYFAEPHALNQQIPAFLAVAEDLLNAVDQNDHAAITKVARQVDGLASGRLLDSLDAAVSQYAADSEALFRQSEIRVLIITIAMLMALATEAMFVFRPLLLRMRDLVSVAQSDPLTGCWNRRSFIEAAVRELLVREAA